jgi:hypothetical protein
VIGAVVNATGQMYQIIRGGVRCTRNFGRSVSSVESHSDVLFLPITRAEDGRTGIVT